MVNDPEIKLELIERKPYSMPEIVEYGGLKDLTNGETATPGDPLGGSHSL